MIQFNFLTNILPLYWRKSNWLITQKGFTNCPSFHEVFVIFTLEVTSEKAKDKIIFRCKFYNFLSLQPKHSPRWQGSHKAVFYHSALALATRHQHHAGILQWFAPRSTQFLKRSKETSHSSESLVFIVPKRTSAIIVFFTEVTMHYSIKRNFQYHIVWL